MKYIVVQALVVLVILIGCQTPGDINRPGDILAGYITHFDTNLTLNGGYYSVSIFSADSVVPFNKIPVRCDSLRLTRRHDMICYETTYNMEGVPAGKYYVAATWSRLPKNSNEVPIVLGIYGCDTSSACTNYISIVYPNFDGNFRNIISWSDTTHRMN